MLQRLAAEREAALAFCDQIRDDANRDNRDLSESEREQVEARHARIAEIDPLIELERRSIEMARNRPAIIDATSYTEPAGPEYRDAGAFIADMWAAGAGQRAAQQRMERYMAREVAHVTTTDTPGVIPQPILAPVLDWIDVQRPVASALGIRALPGGPTFYRPHVTAHTQVGKQAAEKDELASRKLTIGKLQVDVETYGGYVNVSRQLIDWSSPDAMQIIVNDLAGQYAIETEKALVTKLGGTAGGGELPNDGDMAGISGAVFGAVAKAMSAVGGQGRPIIIAAADVVGKIAPAFAPYNPQNAFGVGFSAGGSAGQQGVIGTVSGVPVIMSSQLAAGKAAVLSTAAVEVYEQRVGTLQVTEPSVLGVQVAYAGYFASVVLNAAGVQALTVKAAA
jgi:HK97 family phage major capsid protein